MLEVGEPANIPIPEQDGGRYAYRRDGHMLVLFFSQPRAHEVRAVESGPVRFALTPLKSTPSLLFLLYTFSSAIPWADAPYHVGLEPEEQRPLLDTLTDETKRLAPSIVLIDRTSTIVRALRVVSFSPQFSRALHGIIRQQLNEPIDGDAYNLALARAYEQYPKPRDLLARRVAHCDGGV